MRTIKAQRIVVKIGTSALIGRNGFLDIRTIKSLAVQIAKIKISGKEILIVTSGAIGVGMKEISLKSRPKDVVMQKLCAAIGQPMLVSKYHSLFQKHGIKIAQILLTYESLSNKKIYNNLRNSIKKMLDLGIVPIINENDPISLDKNGPSFGDNDMLSAMLSLKIGADFLIMLTDVDGLFDKNHKDAHLIKEVDGINKNITSLAYGADKFGLGGMKTKLKAAKLATKAGLTVVIANARVKNVLAKIVDNQEIGTILYPN